MKKAIAILLCLMMLVSCFTACGKAEDTPVADNKAEAEDSGAADAAKRTDLKIQLVEEPASMDSHNDTSLARAYVALNLHANLLTFDENGQLVGELAESWSHNDELTEWTFVLKQGAKFSDGSDITVDDVIYTFQRGKDVGVRDDFKNVASIEALSDTEVKFTLSSPNGRLDYGFAGDGFGIMSKAYVESGADLTSEAAVTSGPYHLVDWTMGTSMTLKANDTYVLGAPEIKDVEFIFIPDRNTAVVALESGQIDILCNGGTLNTAEIEVVETFDGIQFVPRLSTTLINFVPNHRFEPFSDVNIRKAIDLAIDRDYLVAMTGKTRTPAGLIPATEQIGGYLPGYEAHARDLEAAKALMAESSYPDGFSFTVLANSSNVVACEGLQAQLRDIGITMEVEQVANASVIMERVKEGSLDAFCTGVTGRNGDVTGWIKLFNGDYTLNKDNEYAPMLAASNGLVGEERDAMLKEAYDLITEDVPVWPLYWNDGCWACDENLNFGVNNIFSYLRCNTMSWN